MTKRFYQKAACFMLALCAVPCVVSSAESLEPNDDTQMIEYIEQLVENYADTWADEMYDREVVSQDYIKVVNSSNEIVAYEVSFFDMTTLEPMGYIMLSTDLTLENPVIEFSLYGSSISAQQQSDAPAELSSEASGDAASTQDKILISDNMLSYLSAEAASNYEFRLPTYPQPLYDILELEGGLSNDYVGKVKSSKYIQGSSEFSFYTGLDFDKSGHNCAPTAMVNLIFYYESLPSISGLIYNNPTWTYSRICALSDFHNKGGLDNDEVINTLREYVAEREFNISIADYWFDLWSDFTRDINNDLPVFVSIEGWVPDDGEWVAHLVVAVGYIETDNANYLKVADGNNSNQRYLNYDYYSVHEGFSVDIY